jgi:hypothetical protein
VAVAYRLALSARAKRDIDEFLERLADYDPATASRFEMELQNAVNKHVLEWPVMWGYFYLLGRPYRGYLFRVSRRTSYWVVYCVDEAQELVKVARFWNCARDEGQFEV